MIINVTFGEPVQVQSFEVDGSTTIGELEEIVVAMAEIPENVVNSMYLVHEGKVLREKGESLSSYNIKDNDLLAVVIGEASGQPHNDNRSSEQQPTPDDDAEIERVRQHIIGNPSVQAQLRQRQPELVGAAIEDPAAFAQMMKRFRLQVIGHGHERAAALTSLRQNPLDLDAQRRIAQLIQERRIDENMAHALEYHPEAFASVTMLYVPCQVNGVALKAFVDCGAQMTINPRDVVTARCANRCELDGLIDKRFSGVAKGVGTSKILGRIHLVQLQLGRQFLPCSISVIEGNGPDMLLGLDMLKRHQCSIDLLANVLVVHEERIPFLPESELPKDEN